MPIEPPTPYIHYRPVTAEQRGRILVVHGLGVSKNTMNLISSALADGGFDVWTIDLPGHGSSGVGFETDLAERVIRNAYKFLGPGTSVLGHSLGAGLLLDLSATEQFSTMVLLAPPPISISEIHADRVLIATGEFDIPRIRSFAPVAADVGGTRVEFWVLPWGGHTTPVYYPEFIRRMVEWLGGVGGTVRTGQRMFWLALMFVAAVGMGILLLPGPSVARLPTPMPGVLARYVIASGIAIAVLKFVDPLSWLKIFATDYLLGFLFLTGAVGAVYDRAFFRQSTKCARSQTAPTIRHLRLFLKPLAAAAFVIVVFGFVIGSHVLHMTLSDGRWWRFPIIALAGFPLFFHDELIIRPIAPAWKSATVAVLTRVLFLAFLLTGVLVLNRDKEFLVLLTPIIVVFWIALWFASGLVRRNTQDPLSAAVFAAIVQGWAFAAWFVTIAG
jgi:hypothetical protein